MWHTLSRGEVGLIRALVSKKWLRFGCNSSKTVSYFIPGWKNKQRGVKKMEDTLSEQSKGTLVERDD